MNKLVDTYERIKMLENTFFETDMMKMTRITNNEFMIRHTELDKIKIESTIVIEYLFYLYYNSIIAILLTKQK